MEKKVRKPPILRRETVLPPGSVDLYEHYKTLRENDGQLIRWHRLPEEGWISGVCAGLARRFGMKPWKLRTIFVLCSLLLAGIPIAYYVLATTFVPPHGRVDEGVDDRAA